MLTEIAWFMTKAYIILIFAAAVIRSEQILYDTSTYIFRGDGIALFLSTFFHTQQFSLMVLLLRRKKIFLFHIWEAQIRG